MEYYDCQYCLKEYDNISRWRIQGSVLRYISLKEYDYLRFLLFIKISGLFIIGVNIDLKNTLRLI